MQQILHQKRLQQILWTVLLEDKHSGCFKSLKQYFHWHLAVEKKKKKKKKKKNPRLNSQGRGWAKLKVQSLSVTVNGFNLGVTYDCVVWSSGWV